MRIFVAGLIHETNSFSPLPTSVQSYADVLLIRSSEPGAMARIAAQAELGGVVAEAAAHGDLLMPGLFAQTQPSGPLSRADYELLREDLLTDLRASMPVDSVVLVLHGAMLAEGYPDCEGDLLGRVRTLVGPDVPVGALLDLHGNLSPAMINSGALLIAVKEYPHIDYAARGRELMGLLRRMAAGELRVRGQWQRVPMLGIFGTTEPPMSEFVRSLQAAEQRPGLLSISAMHGFPWSDTPHTSAALLVYSEDNAEAAGTALFTMQELAESFYALRERAAAKRLPLAAALDQAQAAMQLYQGPVVLADTADNPGGGAACDSTFVLKELLARGIANAALGMIWDPQAVAIATAAGVGAKLRLRIGGKVGPLSGDPVDLEVEVLACRTDAKQRGLTPGGFDDLGAAVALRTIGTDGEHGIMLVLNSIRQQVFSPDCFTELGVTLEDKRLIVVKSTQHFRAGFDALAAATIYADSPGSLQVDLSAMPYKHLPRPVWPLDW